MGIEQAKRILNASALWRFLMALCDRVGRQWRRSRVVHWFLHPAHWGPELSESSIFFRIWSWFRHGLCQLYQRLNLNRLFDGSIFLHTWVWCALPVVLAPLIFMVSPSIIVLGLALIGSASLLLALIRNPERRLVWTPINRYVILYAAIYFAGTLFSVDVESSLAQGLLTICYILFCVVLGNAVTGRRQLDLLISLIVLVGAVVSLYGIFQYIFRWGYQSAAWVDSDMFSSIEFRVPGTMGNPNMLGQYFILVIPLGVAKLFNAWERRERGLWLFCCAVMCLCIILTFSRGAWLGLLFALIVFAMLLQPRLILLAPVALLLLAFLLPDAVVARFTSIGDMQDRSTTYRVYIWMGTLDMLKDFWLSGIGPGTTAFNKVYPAYSYSTIVAPHAHNLFLQIVCDAGICALAVFLLLLFVYFRMMCTAMSQEKNWTSRLLQSAFIGGMCGFLVQAMTDYSFYNYRIMFLFWAFLALGGLTARRSRLPEGRLSH